MRKLLPVVLLGLAACTATTPEPVARPSAPSVAVTRTGPGPTGSVPAAPAATAPATCPVTMPRPFVSPSGDATQLFGASSAAGNDGLWVGGLGENGVITRYQSLEPDGSMTRKLGWTRLTPGTLVITGRRLDASAPPLRSSVPDGYGDLGFQSTVVIFPTPGCWEVTGKTETATLTFVTYVDFT